MIEELRRTFGAYYFMTLAAQKRWPDYFSTFDGKAQLHYWLDKGIATPIPEDVKVAFWKLLEDKRFVGRLSNHFGRIRRRLT